MAADRVYLHIGAPKTGTTYLQSMLARNRDALAAHGVTYPALQGDAHHRAAWDLRGTPPQRKDFRNVEGTWQSLVEQINSGTGTALLSSEHFLFAADPDVQRALTAFRGEVHVIYTARDLVRQVPAVWQERIKNQQSIPYRKFVSSLMKHQGSGWRSFWKSQDPATLLPIWASGGDPSRVHVVTAPPSGSGATLLWDRFVSVLGLTGAEFDTSHAAPANTSMGMTQTELLRRYNSRFGDALTWAEYRRLTKSERSRAFAAIRDDRKISLTEEEYGFFAAEAHRITTALTQGGFDIVGDLNDLEPVTPSTGVTAGGLNPTELTNAELLGAALDVIHALLGSQAEDKDTHKGKGKGQSRSTARERGREGRA